MKQNFFENPQPASSHENNVETKKNELAWQQTEARSVVERSSFFEGADDLERRGLLQTQMERVRNKCEEVPRLGEFLDKHPQYLMPLTMIELYDSKTYEHCVNTFRIAAEHMDEVLDYGIVLRDKIQQEGELSVDEYLGACLLHDTGKIETPNFIIKSSIRDNQWAQFFVENYATNKDHSLLNDMATQENLPTPNELFVLENDSADVIAEKKQRLTEMLNEHGIRMAKYVPIKYGCDPSLGEMAYTEQNMRELDQMGISIETPLLKIIERHEENSQKILEKIGLSKEALLAGMHHDYAGKHKEINKHSPFTVSSFKITTILSEFLQIADIQDALTKNRTYHEGVSKVEALSEILNHVKDRRIHFFVAYLWISKEMHNIAEIEKTDDTVQLRRIRHINSFLSKIKSVIDRHIGDSPIAENIFDKAA